VRRRDARRKGGVAGEGDDSRARHGL